MMGVFVQQLPAGPDQLWLTTLVRPVGVLTGAALTRLVDELNRLARYTNIVVVNLVRARVPDPAELAAALREPGRRLSGPYRCLLLVGANPELLAMLREYGGEVAVMAEPAAP